MFAFSDNLSVSFFFVFSWSKQKNMGDKEEVLEAVLKETVDLVTDLHFVLFL